MTNPERVEEVNVHHSGSADKQLVGLFCAVITAV